MGVTETISSMRQHTADVWAKIEEKGGTIPAQKNIANLAEAIRSIPVEIKSELLLFKEALDKGKAESKYPVGTEIPDKYAGNDNPLVVAQYLDSSNNSSYGGAEGAICIRKYVEPTSQVFGSAADYRTSSIKNFLDTDYINNCSDDLKSVISDINIQVSLFDISTLSNATYIVNSKFFLMSNLEVCGYTSWREGMFWDIWKKRTGIVSEVSGNVAANPGRIVTDRNGTACAIWLRTYSRMGSVDMITLTGSASWSGVSGNLGVLPACFITKRGN